MMPICCIDVNTRILAQKRKYHAKTCILHMEHTICVKTKDMKRTYNAINAHRTENVEEHTHTFNRTQKRSNLERMRSKRRKRAAAVYPPPYRTSRGPQHQGNPPPHPRLSPDSMKPPTDLPPLESEFRPVRTVAKRLRVALRVNRRYPSGP